MNNQFPLLCYLIMDASMPSCTSTMAWMNMARACMDLERYEETLDASDGALALQPDFGDAWMLKMHALISLNRYEQALDVARQAHTLGLGPLLRDVWHHHARELHKIGRIAEAIKAMDVGLILDPELVDGWVSNSGCLLELYQHEEALQAAGQALRLNPELCRSLVQ